MSSTYTSIAYMLHFRLARKFSTDILIQRLDLRHYVQLNHESNLICHGESNPLPERLFAAPAAVVSHLASFE